MSSKFFRAQKENRLCTGTPQSHKTQSRSEKGGQRASFTIERRKLQIELYRCALLCGTWCRPPKSWRLAYAIRL